MLTTTGQPAMPHSLSIAAQLSHDIVIVQVDNGILASVVTTSWGSV